MLKHLHFFNALQTSKTVLKVVVFNVVLKCSEVDIPSLSLKRKHYISFWHKKSGPKVVIVLIVAVEISARNILINVGSAKRIDSRYSSVA